MKASHSITTTDMVTPLPLQAPVIVKLERVVFQLVSAEGSNVSDGTSQCTESAGHSDGKNQPERTSEPPPLVY